MAGIVREGFGGPGGWAVAMRALGLTGAGFELDEAACATRAAAGHPTVRADISRIPAAFMAGKVTGSVDSPPCVFFSAAGTRAGIAVMDILAAAVRDQFAGRKTLAARRREMARALRAAGWKRGKDASRSGSYHRMASLFDVVTDADGNERVVRRRRLVTHSAPAPMDVTWNAVRSASLVVEPARFIAATRPEWVALEQVPDVLPLWRVYADELRKLGYSVWCGKLNAADYGVPQTRTRAILIASRVRRVSCPVPTHYDPRKGMQLFGTPWVSMAEALGMGATARPAPTVTAGGTKSGGAEPFGHRDRDALEAERDAGRWVVNPNASGQMRGYTRPVERPSPSLTGQVQFWSLRRDRGAGLIERGGERADHEIDGPAPTITAGSGGSGPRLSWSLRMDTQARSRGEHQSAAAVRITVAEAAALQSFPAGYPWQGSKTKQYEQVGNAIPVLLAIAVLGEAIGADWVPIAERYAPTTRLNLAGAA